MIKKYENWNPPLSEKAIKRRGGYKNRSNSRQWAHWWQNRKETRESPRYSRKIGDGGLFQMQVAPLHSTLGSLRSLLLFFFLSSLGIFNDAKLHRAPRGFFLFLFGRLYCFLSRLELKITSATCRNISPGLSNFVSTLLYQSWKCLPHRLSSSFLSGGVENFFFSSPVFVLLYPKWIFNDRPAVTCMRVFFFLTSHFCWEKESEKESGDRSRGPITRNVAFDHSSCNV